MTVNKPTINIVAALGTNTFAIGRGNRLLWYIPEDLRHFKNLTLSHPVIMGRKTFESILDYLGKPLPNRHNIIVTRNRAYKTHDEVVVCHSLEEALEYSLRLDREQIFVTGGAELYNQAFQFAENLYLTFVEDDKDGDAYFPQFGEEITRDPEYRLESILKGRHQNLRYAIVRIQKSADDISLLPMSAPPNRSAALLSRFTKFAFG